MMLLEYKKRIKWLKIKTINSVKLLFILYKTAFLNSKPSYALQEIITSAIITLLHAFFHFWNEQSAKSTQEEKCNSMCLLNVLMFPPLVDRDKCGMCKIIIIKNNNFLVSSLSFIFSYHFGPVFLLCVHRVYSVFPHCTLRSGLVLWI